MIKYIDFTELKRVVLNNAKLLNEKPDEKLMSDIETSLIIHRSQFLILESASEACMEYGDAVNKKIPLSEI
jgi:hypothetical protein